MKNLTRKRLELITWIANLADIAVLKKIIELKKETDFYKKFPVMTKEQLIKNTLVSEEDIKLGRVHNIESVEKEDWD